MSEWTIREWTYDDPALVVRVVEDGRGLELEQHDAFAVIRLRIYEPAHLRRLGELLLARAEKMDAEHVQFRRHIDRKMAEREAGRT